MEFEWDEDKRTINLKKHGFDFLDAKMILDGVHLLKRLSYPKEPRWMAIGTLFNVEVTLIYTKRHNRVRIISMRRARHEERRQYHTLCQRRDR